MNYPRKRRLIASENESSEEEVRNSRSMYYIDNVATTDVFQTVLANKQKQHHNCHVIINVCSFCWIV